MAIACTLNKRWRTQVTSMKTCPPASEFQLHHMISKWWLESKFWYSYKNEIMYPSQ